MLSRGSYMTNTNALPKDDKAIVLPVAAPVPVDAKKDEAVKTPSDSSDKK
jgi:hypothetical protein